MNFTSRINTASVISGFLIIVLAGLIGWVHHVVSVPAPMHPEQYTFANQNSFPMSDAGRLAPEVTPTPAFQTPGGAYYQPVASWYKNKHWWKRNAPIVGGAGGGALVGGLVGGGTGALIGGAVGGGGGYVYKRSRHHHYHH